MLCATTDSGSGTLPQGEHVMVGVRARRGTSICVALLVVTGLVMAAMVAPQASADELRGYLKIKPLRGSPASSSPWTADWDRSSG